jgi:hypothetical protein
MVPSRSEARLSPARVSSCQVSTEATNVPAMGVHSPGMRRIPEHARTAHVIVVLMGGSVNKIEPARTISAEPTTKRISSKPVPGQPLANVE